MKHSKILLVVFIDLLFCMLCTTAAAEANDFKYDSETCKTVVSRDDEGYLSFTKTPWKCVVMRENGDAVITVYYNRNGVPKASGQFKPQGEYFFSVYVKDGKYYNTYNTQAILDKDGKLETTVAKKPNQMSVFRFLYGNKKIPEKLRHNNTTHVDKYGNWIYAGDWFKEGLIRKLYYYDDGYDAEEDARIDEICRNAPSQHNDEQITQAFQAIPVYIVGLIIKFCWLLLVVYLLLLLFKREWAYRPFNSYAGRRVTPYGLFCKTQLHGIIPVVLLFLPSLLIFGTLAMAEWNGDAFQWSLVMIVSLALSLAYCRLFVKRKSPEIGRKTAIAIIAFAVWSVLALVAVVAIAVVAIWVAIVLAFLFAGLSAAIGGFISGTAGAWASVAGAVGSGSGDACNDYEPMLDPYNGDDGGVLEGTSRVPLRDNGDGTMTDNRGRLYAKDGGRVRRL